MSVPYITLTNSNASLSKNFRVLLEGYRPSKRKNMTVTECINGGLDVSMGGIRETHQYTIRVRHTETSGSGTLSDLETFYSYTNPSGTPSNIITLVDNDGNSHNCIMSGTFDKTSLTSFITGTEAWFFVNCEFIFLT